MSRPSIIAVALMCATLYGQTPSARKFVIAGMVVRDPSQQPVKGARVTITQNDHTERTASLVTGADGRFTFTDVPSAKYTLQAEVHGEQRTFEQDGMFSTGIVTGPALDSEHIVFRFPVSAALSVKVIDDEGEPVTGAQILLFSKGIVEGWPRTHMVVQSATDPEGSTRFLNLESGTYYASATGTPWYAQNAAASQGAGMREEDARQLDVAYPVTYYTATQDPEAAAPIHVSAGEQPEIQIALRASPAMRISLDGLPGSPDPGNGGQIMTAVGVAGPAGIRYQIPQAASYQEEHAQRQILGVAPGNYFVSAAAYLSTGGLGIQMQSLGSVRVSAGTGEVQLHASQLIRTVVAGQVTFAAGVQPINGLVVWIGQPANGQRATCPVAHDGSFHCSSDVGGITPGAYEIKLFNANDLYIETLLAKGAVYRSGLLHIQEGSNVSLSILAAPGQTKLNGIALTGAKPCSGAMILLVPQDLSRGAFIPRDQSDSDGTFTLPDVHPGRYLLLAIDHGRNLEYHSPAVLEPYLAAAQSLVIPRQTSDPVRIQVQPRRP